MRHGKRSRRRVGDFVRKPSAFAENAVAQALEIDDLNVHVGRVSESVDEKPLGRNGGLFGYDQKGLLLFANTGL